MMFFLFLFEPVFSYFLISLGEMDKNRVVLVLVLGLVPRM